MNESGSFTATGQSDPVNVPSGTPFNLTIWGTFVGTVQLERRVDGANWAPVSSEGTPVEFTEPCSEVVSAPASSQYRLNCTAYTSGTINWRLSE